MKSNHGEMFMYKGYPQGKKSGRRGGRKRTSVKKKKKKVMFGGTPRRLKVGKKIKGIK